jgi:pyridoxamine 5'-phosphate oxidase
MARSLSERSAHPDPVAQFERWYRAAGRAQRFWREAVVLATADTGGRPSVRAVMLRGLDARGLVFFTDHRSRKARELAARPRAAMVFLWAPLERQVRVEGRVERIGEAESDEYFATRPRGSRVGAWASQQSKVIAGRGVLARQIRRIEARFRAADVPRPPHWGGYRLVPDAFEFWQGRPDRLHDRLRYRRVRGAWRIERLSP